MKIVYVAEECNFGQRISVCSRIDKETKQNVRNQNKVVDILSPTNR